ncbi:PaaI family thioesterase [Alkalilimnicola ehrlichii]|uniref:PaaI family thioesterase n=1 Tax=Alkalilimnicola ehrlichii TaxID=351052 RepID=UPI003B9E2B23
MNEHNLQPSLEALRDRLRGWPYARLIGMDAEVGNGGLGFRLTYRDELIGNPALPAIHGGVLGGFMELAAQAQILWEAGNELEGLPRVVDFSIDYLRPGRPEDVMADCRVWRQGQRVANIAVVAWQGDPERIIATARGHFLMPAAAHPPRS